MRICITVILLSFALSVSACSYKQNDDQLLTVKDIITSFEKQGLYLTEDGTPPISFNCVRSAAYKIDQEWIYIFVYETTEELKQGLAEYYELRKKSVGWIPGKVYEIDNAFILHLKEEMDLDAEIKKVINSLM